MKKHSVNSCWLAANQPSEFTSAATSFVLLLLEPFPALLQQRHRAFLRRGTPAKPSPLASSILSATPGALLFSPLTRVGGGEGIVFLFSLHALVATALLTRAGPRVCFGVLTPGHRRISERAARRERDRRTLRLPLEELRQAGEMLY